MYKFSAPLPFSKNLIDKIIFINNQVKNSKIVSLYFSLPSNSFDFTGFEQGRYWWNFITDFNYFKPLIEYSISQGFDFIYLLNSPKIYNPEFDNVDEKLEKLDRLINNLRKIGCNKVRVCNPQLMGYFNQNYPDFELYLSTSVELQSIKQYANLFSMFKNIKEFVPSWDLNKNFMFLKNIRTRFPDIKIELMVNEGCLPACPVRTAHNIHITGSKKNTNRATIFTSNYFVENCSKIIYSNTSASILNPNIIYPWELKSYREIGINNFKFVGRNNVTFKNGLYLDLYKIYLSGADNNKNILNSPVRYFNNYIHAWDNINFKIKDIKPYLLDINHFKKYGHLCSSVCGVECRYCYKCAEKIQKVFLKKQQAEIKKTVPVCVQSRMQTV